MKKLSTRFVRVMMYVFGFVNIIAAVIGCGYVLLKDEDEGNRTAAKRALILSAVFVGLDAVVDLYRAIVISLIGAGGAAVTVATVLSALILIARIAVFAVLAILAYTEYKPAAGGDKAEKKSAPQTAAEPPAAATDAEHSSADAEETDSAEQAQTK